MSVTETTLWNSTSTPPLRGLSSRVSRLPPEHLRRFVLLGLIRTVRRSGCHGHSTAICPPVGSVELAALSPTAAYSLGFAISTVFNYLVNKHVTFDADATKAVAVLRFTLTTIVGLTVTRVCMRMLTSFGLHYLLSQVLTTAIVSMINFQLASRWVFRRR
jgi:putative flippase GtrA